MGTHDFTQFANLPPPNESGRNPVKTLSRCEVVDMPGGFRVEVCSSDALCICVTAAYLRSAHGIS